MGLAPDYDLDSHGMPQGCPDKSTLQESEHVKFWFSFSDIFLQTCIARFMRSKTLQIYFPGRMSI
jgi:hypothetical protein